MLVTTSSINMAFNIGFFLGKKNHFPSFIPHDMADPTGSAARFRAPRKVGRSPGRQPSHRWPGRTWNLPPRSHRAPPHWDPLDGGPPQNPGANRNVTLCLTEGCKSQWWPIFKSDVSLKSGEVWTHPRISHLDPPAPRKCLTGYVTIAIKHQMFIFNFKVLAVFAPSPHLHRGADHRDIAWSVPTFPCAARARRAGRSHRSDCGGADLHLPATWAKWSHCCLPDV